MPYLWVAIGGAAGAVARYGLGNAIAGRLGRDLPWGTLTINVTGSLLIGVILTWLIERDVGASTWRPLIVVGVLGGYTTFSAFSYEVVALADDGQYGRAAGYAIASLALGIAACVLGVALTHAALR